METIIDSRNKNNNKQLKTKKKLNIAIYLSNEDRFKPLLLAMFWQISKIARTPEEGNEIHQNQLNTKLFVGIEEYTIICLFKNFDWFKIV